MKKLFVFQYFIKNKYLSSILLIGMVFILYKLVYELKQNMFGITDYSVIMIFGRQIIDIMIYINLFNLIYFCQNKKINELCYKTVIISAVIVIISMPFSNYLKSLGLITSIAEDVELSSINIMAANRFPGIYLSSINALGTFLNIILGFIVLHYSKSKLKFILLFFFIFLGILLTASRMAFATFLIILFIYFLSTRKYLVKVRYLMTLISFLIILIISIDFIAESRSLGYVFERFSERGITTEIATGGTKYTGYRAYTNFVLKKGSWVILGVDEEIKEYRDVHNVFIKMFYYGGLVLILPFLLGLIRLVKYAKANNILYDSLLIIIPVVISFSLISAYGFIYIFILFSGIIFFKETLIENIKKGT